MFCRNCGTKIEGGTNFCHSCGSQVNIAPVTTIATNAQSSIVIPNSGRSSNRVMAIIVCIIGVVVLFVIIGFFSTLVTADSEYIRARDSKRLSDLKQLQTALELYHFDQGVYPTSNQNEQQNQESTANRLLLKMQKSGMPAVLVLGTDRYACLNAKGWQTAGCSDPYMSIIPTDPKSGKYVYTSNGEIYSITASLEGEMNGLQGQLKLTPEGIEQL